MKLCGKYFTQHKDFDRQSILNKPATIYLEKSQSLSQIHSSISIILPLMFYYPFLVKPCHVETFVWREGLDFTVNINC